MNHIDLSSESDPKCTVNMTRVSLEHELLKYTCQVVYRGELPPTMHWSNQGTSVPNAKVIDDSIPGRLAKVSILVEVTLDRVGDIYTCDTFFDYPDLDAKDFAKNAPGYVYSYEAPPLIIQRMLFP